MLRNYLKVAIRNIWKYKLVSIINTLGLAIGIAFAGLAFLFIRHEISFDKAHDPEALIYYITSTVNNSINIPGAPGPVTIDLQETLPGVTAGLRMEEKEFFIRSGSEVFKEKTLVVDTNFFDFFNIPVGEGDDHTVLSQINNMVLTRDMAKKYFGHEDIVGELLEVILSGEKENFRVAAVAENPPSNSSLDFDFILPINAVYKNNSQPLQDWHALPFSGFIRVRSTEDLAEVENQLQDYSLTKYDSTQGSVFDFHLSGFQDYHLGYGMDLNGLKTRTNLKYLIIFGLIALIVLAMACFNFMNLTNALGSQRLTEIGVRQVLGAGRKQLMRQFLVESVTLSAVAMVFAFFLIDFAAKLLPDFFDLRIQIDWLSPATILPILLLVVLTGLLAGLYPSVLLSRLKPHSIFKSVAQFGGNNLVTRGSLVFQFTISIGLLACAVIMFQQQQFLKHENLGFTQDQILVIDNQVDFTNLPESERRFQLYDDMITNLPGIEKIAGVSNSFTRGNRAQIIQDKKGGYEFIYEYRIDPDYLDLLNIQLTAGRNFLKDSEEDRNNSIIVNRAFVDQYEIENPLQYVLPERFEAMAGAKIIGVTDNFHFGSLKSKVYPMMMHMRTNVAFQHLLAKLNTNDISNTVYHLKKAWQEVNPERPFEFYFLDEDIQRQYEAENRWSAVTRIATVMAIIITIFGLFGLISLSLSKRTKEISIRKILGSSIPDLIFLFSRDFLFLLLVSFLIAVPVVWLIMDQWLENFAYGISVQVWVFFLSGLLIMLISLLTITYHGFRAAQADPVNSLRNE